MNALLVIDVQNGPTVCVNHRTDGQPFAPGEQEAVRAVLQEQADRRFQHFLGRVCIFVAQAKARGELVIVLEDASLGLRTHPVVMQELGAYPHVCSRKPLHDGSPQVLAALDLLGRAVECINVCGALTDVCVKATVEGLRASGRPVELRVLPGGCFDREWGEADAGGPTA